MVKKINKRLLALDVLRGITISGMILVNNPGSWDHIYEPLEHASWIGLTPTDLVFPFFMFIMGVSTYLSLRKYQFKFDKNTALKIIRRTVVIFGIGLAIAWLSLSLNTWNSLSDQGLSFWQQLWTSCSNFSHLRIMGVMPRLALCYGGAAVIALTIKHKHIPYLIIFLLIGYTIMLFLGNGFAYNDTNILSRVDRFILGGNHMYKDNGIDPEGILSTIPALAHVLIGFCVGKMLMEVEELNDKIERLFLVGVSLTFVGFLFSYGCPISKKIWSPTFVLTTCGLASSLLALLIWLIDKQGYKGKLTRFLESFGVNPLFIYVFADVLGIFVGRLLLADGSGLTQHLFYFFQPIFGDKGGSLVYALLFVTINWYVSHILYKRKIYIKI